MQTEIGQHLKFIEKEHFINIPVTLVEDEGCFIIATTKDSEDKIGSSIVVGGGTLEEAEREFWKHLQYINDWEKKRSRETG